MVKKNQTKKYNNLKEESEKINKKIYTLILNYNKSAKEEKKIKTEYEIDGEKKELELKHHPPPIEFNQPVTYLFLNINPSISNKSDNFFLNDESQEHILNSGDQKQEELKLSKKDNYKQITYPFYNKLYNLINEIDNEAISFWNEKKTLQKYRTFWASKKEELEIYNKVKDLEPKTGKYILYAELFYYRHSNQKEIVNLIEKEKELKEKIIKFLESQINYYKPKNIIITNAWVSNFFLNNICENKELTSFKKYKNINIFFGSMLTGQRAMDLFSKKRLQNEIKMKCNLK